MSLHSLLPQRGALSLQSILHNGRETLDAARRIYGVVPARVKAIHDPKNNRHQQSHVQVWFPWLQQQDDEKLFTPWARCVAPDAGNKDKTGFKMSPNHAPLDGGEPLKVGDEVLVAFEHGDPHVPYVLGALWNKQQNIPEPTTPADGNDCSCYSGGPTLKTPSYKPDSIAGGSGNNKIMFIKSRNGNLMVMDDKTGTIRLNDRTGNSAIQLEEEQILLLQRKNAIHVWAKNTISFACETFQIHAQGRIFYKADKNVSLSAKGNISNFIGGKLYRCPTHTKNTSPVQMQCTWPKPKGGKDGGFEPCNTGMVLWKNGGLTEMKAGKDFNVSSKKTVSIRSDKNMDWMSMKETTICSATDNVKVESSGTLTALGLKGVDMASQQKVNLEGKSMVTITTPMEGKFLASGNFIAKGAVIMLN